MSNAFPSLRHRFLRIFISIAAVSTLLIAVGLSTDDYFYQRRMQIQNMQQVADAASHMLLLVTTHHKASQLGEYLESFKSNTKLVRLCIYDASDKLISFWERPGSEHCPALMTKTGIETDALFVRISMPLERDGQYIGIVYAQGELYTIKRWLICVLKGLICLFAIAAAASWFAARLSANSIVPPLLALRQQIDCLKGNDIVACAIPSYAMTKETAELSSGISSLRVHFDETTVPRETLANVRSWHWEVLSELLATMRHRVNPGSPLIEGLNDYALLLQTLRGDLLPPPRPFGLQQTMNTALEAARLSSPDTSVNLTASLTPSLQKYWCGHPEMMEALMRHLLLIGLKRTQKGFVSLKLEAYTQNNLASSHRLRLILKDSGPFMQRWQMQQWLALSMDDMPPQSMTGDISWLLVSRLFKRLGGNLEGDSDKEGGLSLEGNLPLSHHSAGAAGETNITDSPQAHRTPPLVLMVENDKENLDNMKVLFAQAGCEIFAVPSHKLALEWAPVLPFSVIIINTAMSDATQDITRRLRHMAEDGGMPQIPLWAATAKFSFVDFDYWQRQGVAELLLKPYQPEVLRSMIVRLPQRDNLFYLTHNQLLREDMSAAISFPDMIRMLGEQILQVEPTLESLAHNQLPEDGRHRAHSVRSAALTLGYFRLAALMGQIEHASLSPLPDFPAANWKIVSEMLKCSGFEKSSY